MVTLQIDDKTFAFWRKQATERGLSVEEWLKTTVTGLAGEHRGSTDRTIPEKLERFDDLTRTLDEMRIHSGGTLDDSREVIYQDRGI